MNHQAPKVEPLRIIIVDGSRMGCELLGEALARDTSLQIVSSCATHEEVLEAVGSQPDVVVMSANLGDAPFKGLEVCRDLRRSYPSLPVVMLIDAPKPDLVIGCFGAGARGIFCRTQSIDGLRKCIYSVHAGQIWATSNEMRLVLDNFLDNTPPMTRDAKEMALLSKREQEVVRCVTEGLSNREIASRLKLSEHTVKNYIFRIFDKLGVSTRVEMVLCVLSRRLTNARGRSAEEENGNGKGKLAVLDHWFCAAEQGFALAHLKVGDAHRDGNGVQVDNIVAATSFLIADRIATACAEQARAKYENLAANLGQDELAEASRKAEEWICAHPELRQDLGISNHNPSKSLAEEQKKAPMSRRMQMSRTYRTGAPTRISQFL